ncbi:ATP-dependent DNA ligase [Candidatus Nomurabacteria bacterium]|uniref:DNA ligase n=1 Tax=candidate division WWE3 bacterium TaxID=2053526 RepID=A0A955IVQ2_UNCKA|nr:ATP-dependent DNA ligase [candidate division WWE3 bacterium]MCB9823572.1 ATP-dependent DNA ligase [Candidatus Nomurabacteria bacterium]MCB9827367.1 ATP-dependent DNA ligase [Candidatus Nomurabacteria bacterium]
MQFGDYSKYLQRLENTSARLEITSILAEMIEILEPEEIKQAVYLSLGYLDAPFKSIKFNMAEKLALRAISIAYNIAETDVENLYNDLGDLGLAAEKLSLKHQGQEPIKKQTVVEVYNALLKIANASGTGSQDKKIITTAELLKSTDSVSAKFIIRIILGTNRLGFTELTILDALAKVLGKNKKFGKSIEEKYNTHPDIGYVTYLIKTKGEKGLRELDIEIGIPILAQKCQRLSGVEEILEKMGEVYAEYKFDGTRVQLHMDRSVLNTARKSLFEELKEDKGFLIKTYTRNLEETTHQYPEIVTAANKQIKAESAILDGEAIGYDRETGEFLPFQQTIQRKRKHNISELAQEIPLKYFVFDILYLNGESLLNKTLAERKKILGGVIKSNDNTTDTIVVVNYQTFSEAKKLSAFFEKVREKKLEGIIAKNPMAPYQAGARSYTWVKFKVADDTLLDDTIDVVILGYYLGRGIRNEFGIGGFLAGIFDSATQTYKSITKVGTGLKDEELKFLKSQADKIMVKGAPKEVEVPKGLAPDVWTKPQLVVEISGDEITKSPSHSSGFAMRFPRLIGFRVDKNVRDITTLKEIEDLYKLTTGRRPEKDARQ